LSRGIDTPSPSITTPTSASRTAALFRLIHFRARYAFDSGAATSGRPAR
jgi:hypothetical protein